MHPRRPRGTREPAVGFLGMCPRVQRGSAMNPAERVVRRVDAFQQRHRVTGFAFGVVKKFGDDRAGSLAALATTIFSGFSVFNSTVPALRGLSMLVSVLLNVAISLAGFRLLTPKIIPWRDLLPGAVLTGVAWSVLQLLGGYLVSQRLQQ